MTGYVISYYADGNLTGSQNVSANVTSVAMTGLDNSVNNSISVMALSEQPYLPGRSARKNILSCKSFVTSIHSIRIISHILYHSGNVSKVVLNGSNTTSVSVSWEEVEGADNYTVSFSTAVGDDQEGLCTDDYHSASVTVNVSTASIAVGEDVDSNETSLLRAYTTYSVTVVAFSSEWGTAEGREMFTTLQTSIKIDAIA